MMGIPKDTWRENSDLSDWSIMVGYRGSIAHGMYIPSSDPNSIDDRDAIAVCVPPESYYLGLDTYGSRGTREIKRDEWDIVIYELRKALSLLLKGNPNVLMTLYLDDRHYIKRTAAWNMIVSNRDLFLGKHVYRSFVGYAHGQLHRMTHFAFEGYMGSKRKALVERFGYDTKNAAHLIRLLRMGLEYFTEGRLHVERYDAQQLLEIKRGEWSLEQVKSMADELFADVRHAYMNSDMPSGPDRNAVNELCIEVIKMAREGE